MPTIFAHQGARTALALAISASLSFPSFAQGPVTDMDNWTRFPPRPRTPAPTPSETTTASPPPAATPTPQPIAKALAVTPPPSPTPNPRDSWVQFPIRSATPAVMNVPPLQTQAPPQVAPVEQAANEPKIKKINFKGNQRTTDQQLSRVVEKYVGVMINTDVLIQATEAVNNFYRKMGYLAFAEMPNQDLTDGTVLIQIAEARFSGAVVEDPTGQLSKTNLVQKIIENQHPKNALVD